MRKTFPKSAAAEIAWFLSGSQDPSFIKKYAPFWDKFVEQDNGKDVIKSSYGYRWRKHFGRDQISDAIEALKQIQLIEEYILMLGMQNKMVFYQKIN